MTGSKRSIQWLRPRWQWPPGTLPTTPWCRPVWYPTCTTCTTAKRGRVKTRVVKMTSSLSMRSTRWRETGRQSKQKLPQLLLAYLPRRHKIQPEKKKTLPGVSKCAKSVAAPLLSRDTTVWRHLEWNQCVTHVMASLSCWTWLGDTREKHHQDTVTKFNQKWDILKLHCWSYRCMKVRKKSVVVYCINIFCP